MPMVYITESIEEFDQILEAAKRAVAQRDWQCQECGKRMTLKQAEKASSEGCPKCGSVDIDMSESLGEAAKKTAAQRDWQCQECGQLLTLKQAQGIMLGNKRCPKCRGVDVDMSSGGPSKSGTRGRMGEAKRPTFQQARDAILSHLASKGWLVKSDLKVPHATHRDGQWRLYFKPQAVYYDYDQSGRSRFSLNDARSAWIDIRDYAPADFLVRMTGWMKRDQQDQ